MNLVSDIQVDKDDERPEALLAFSRLQKLIDIYSKAPVVDKCDRNQSKGFKWATDVQLTPDEIINQGRAEKLIKFVHQRIEEKFKGFRQAYRSFDKDYNGDLDLKEFIMGLENIGIKLKYQDYKMIFDTIDYDQEGEIDYNKFLLLNTDNKKDEKIE